MDRDLIEQAVVGRLLPKRSAHPPANYHLWERKTWNLHRGVIYLECAGSSSAEDIHQSVRGVVASEFDLKWEWLRGFAFGACVRMSGIPADLHLLENCIDVRNRSRGVFQWLVFFSDEPAVAVGIHTWIEGYLSPVYHSIVGILRDAEIPCETFVRDQGAFFRFAQNAAALKGVKFPEFEDHRRE